MLGWIGVVIVSAVGRGGADVGPAPDCSGNPQANTFYCAVDGKGEWASCWCWEGYFGAPFSLQCVAGSWPAAPDNACTGCTNPPGIPPAEVVISSVSPYGPAYSHVYGCEAGYFAPLLTSVCDQNATTLTWVPQPDTCAECTVPTAAALPPGVVVTAVYTHRVGSVDAPAMATLDCSPDWVGVAVNATCNSTTSAVTWAPYPACAPLPSASPTPSSSPPPTPSPSLTPPPTPTSSQSASPSSSPSTGATASPTPSASVDAPAGSSPGGGGPSTAAVVGGVLGGAAALAAATACWCCVVRRRRQASASAAAAARAHSRMTPIQRYLAALPRSDSNIQAALMPGDDGGAGGGVGVGAPRRRGGGLLAAWFGRGGGGPPASLPSSLAAAAAGYHPDLYAASDSESVASLVPSRPDSGARPPTGRPVEMESVGVSRITRADSDSGASLTSASTARSVVLDAAAAAGGGLGAVNAGAAGAAVAGAIASPRHIRLPGASPTSAFPGATRGDAAAGGGAPVGSPTRVRSTFSLEVPTSSTATATRGGTPSASAPYTRTSDARLFSPSGVGDRHYYNQ